MIKKFKVENFCSIKNEVELCFEAQNIEDNTEYNNIFDFKELKINKVIAFYGMNASGKSTIVKALAALRELVIPTNPFLPYFPFKFDDTSKEAPTNLFIEFSLNNDEESPIYRYSVSYNRNLVLYEKFEKSTSQKFSLLFERKTINNRVSIVLGSKAKSNTIINAMMNTVFSNNTFLSSFQRLKVEDFFDAFDFFLNRLINISPEVTRFIDIVPGSAMEQEDIKKFTISLLQAADFNISDIKIGKTEIPHSAPFIIPNNGIRTEKDTLFLLHKSKTNDGSIEFINESLGTKKITILSEHIYKALSRPCVLVVDELESSLHPELTKMIIKCFLDENINRFNSQLIFTSHDTTLLNLNLLRRDEINFVYKDANDGSTFIRSLKDFHVRLNEKVEKAYLAGRYSTSPETKEYELVGTLNA